jgi:hypothetical protein
MYDVERLDPAPVTDEESLTRFLDQLEARLEAISSQLSLLAFEQYRTKQRPPEREAVEAAQAALMSDPAYQDLVERWVGRVSDPLLARRLVAWQRAFQGARVTARPEIRALVNEIDDAIVSFRYNVQGEELNLGEVRRILRMERDRERRKAAWMAFAPLSRKLAERSRELFHRRNQAAKAEGFSTYAEMQIEAQGLQLAQVKAILEELAEASAPAYRRIIEAGAERHGLSEIQPWDVKFLLDGEGGLPAHYFPRSGILGRLQEWGQVHGVDLDALGISVHFLDIPYNGLCMGIGRRDIRILGNPADGHNYYKTSFHELGHALHAAYSDPGSYILRREPSVFSEGMAEMLGYTVNDPGWLAHVGLSAVEIASANREAMGPWFAYLRQRSAHALFEYEAYANPDGDLDQINAAIESKLLGCAFDPTPRWASEPNAWYSRYPVYWQNYVLADVIASQIHHDLRRRFGTVWGNREAVAYMREQYWAPGGAVEWQEKLIRGTGAPLGTAALVADLAG